MIGGMIQWELCKRLNLAMSTNSICLTKESFPENEKYKFFETLKYKQITEFWPKDQTM